MLPILAHIRAILQRLNPCRNAAKSPRPGDILTISAGELIPADGEVIRGIALVDESAITGESAPVLREAESDHAHVVAGSRVMGDSLVIRVTAARRCGA